MGAQASLLSKSLAFYFTSFWRVSVMTIYDDRRRLTDITAEMSSREAILIRNSSATNRVSSRNLTMQKAMKMIQVGRLSNVVMGFTANLTSSRHFIFTRSLIEKDDCSGISNGQVVSFEATHCDKSSLKLQAFVVKHRNCQHWKVSGGRI